MMRKLVEFLDSTKKAWMLLLLFGVALLGKRVGVDVGVDAEDTGKALVAAVMVYLVPNRTD